MTNDGFPFACNNCTGAGGLDTSTVDCPWVSTVAGVCTWSLTVTPAGGTCSFVITVTYDGTTATIRSSGVGSNGGDLIWSGPASSACNWSSVSIPFDHQGGWAGAPSGGWCDGANAVAISKIP